MVLTTANAQDSSSAGVCASVGTDPVARYLYPEVRIRKLHLVRPDLIPYPLAYDVYC